MPVIQPAACKCTYCMYSGEHQAATSTAVSLVPVANRASFEPEPAAVCAFRLHRLLVCCSRQSIPQSQAASRLPSLTSPVSELHVLDCRLLSLRDSVPAHVISLRCEQSIARLAHNLPYLTNVTTLTFHLYLHPSLTYHKHSHNHLQQPSLA